ncbi:hypothetical protein D3C84_697150 [compost metagenome]
MQGLEVRYALLVGHYHLAVEPGRFQAQAGQCLGLAGQLVSPVMAVASEEPNLVVVDARHDAVAVELDLITPFTARGLFHQRRQFRFDLVR